MESGDYISKYYGNVYACQIENSQECFRELNKKTFDIRNRGLNEFLIIDKKSNEGIIVCEGDFIVVQNDNFSHSCRLKRFTEQMFRNEFHKI